MWKYLDGNLSMMIECCKLTHFLFFKCSCHFYRVMYGPGLRVKQLYKAFCEKTAIPGNPFSYSFLPRGNIFPTISWISWYWPLYCHSTYLLNTYFLIFQFARYLLTCLCSGWIHLFPTHHTHAIFHSYNLSI